MFFTPTIISVAIMLAFALPGYIFVKIGAIKAEGIRGFACVLMYFCQPFLTIYSFISVKYTPELGRNMGIVLAFAIGLQVLFLLIVFLIFRKKGDNRPRIMAVAASFGNVGFMGVPLLQAVMPNFPEAISYSAIICTVMFVLSWSIGAKLIAGEGQKVSVVKMFVSPPIIGIIIALPLFFCNVELPAVLYNNVEILGRMTTPMCMLLLGMRFATVEKKSEVFTDPRLWITSGLKLVILPLLAFLVMFWIPIDSNIKKAVFILFCTPCASMTQNIAELYNNGQRFAANTVLNSTICCIATIPLLSFMLVLL